MQVTSVNTTASAISPQSAEDSARRADDFARVLQNAFYGAGSKAVANGAQQASETTPRTETRPVERSERPAADRPVEKAAERSESRDSTAKTETAPRDPAAKPAEKPAQKTEDKPAADAKPVKDDAAADTKPADAPKAEGESKAADAGKTAAEAGEELTEAKDETKPAVVAAPDAALILSLLQTQMPVAVAAVAPTAAPVVEGEAAAVVAAPVAAAAPVVAAPVAAAPQVPVDAAAAALAAAAAAAATAVAGQVPAEAAPQAGVDTAAQDAAAKLAAAAAQAAVPQGAAADATQTSVAALLSQQQTMSKEDFAAIQQALAVQAQAQLQDDVKTGVAEPQQQTQLAPPLVAAAVAAPKTEGKTEKSNLTIDVQTVTAVAPKTLVDQSALMSMQGDDDLADAALLQQQAQAQVQQQPVGADVKFAATLQSQLVTDAPQPLNPAAVQASPSHLATQAVSGASAPAAQASQASHAAQQQTLARNLNAYIPAGEQVAVQIKKGAAEGIDKISIRLDPGNLGNVEIKMEVGHDGRLMAVIAADKPETLQMLQKDAASLEQSLRDAGLKTDQQSLSFSLRDQNQAQSGREGRDGNGYGRQRGGRGADEYADAGRIDPAQAAAAQAQRAAAARGGLDIKI